MNNYPCSHSTWLAHVRGRHPSELLPTEWITPRRLDEQRRGQRPAMTYGELQRMLAADAPDPRALPGPPVLPATQSQWWESDQVEAAR